MRAQGHEIIRPDMVAVFRPEPHTGILIEPQPSPFGLFLRHLQSFLAPNAFHSFMIDCPALRSHEGGDASIPIAAILPSEPDHHLG